MLLAARILARGAVAFSRQPILQEQIRSLPAAASSIASSWRWDGVYGFGSAAKAESPEEDIVDIIEEVSKETPTKEELQALGLPGDIAEMLANEKIEYPLLVERIVARAAGMLAEQDITQPLAAERSAAVENALLLTAAELAKKREDADAAKKAAEAAHSEKDRHAGIVHQLKEQLIELEKRLKAAAGHIMNRAILDRDEDRMKHGSEPAAGLAAKEARIRTRTELWRKWTSEHPEETADLAASAGWRPEDVPREIAELYEMLRDYDSLDELIDQKGRS